MRRFLKEASYDTYLLMKVVMIVGNAGACRREELFNLSVKNVEDKGELIIINIPNTKTNIPRNFTIMNEPSEDELCFLETLRKYVNLRPKDGSSERFFYGFRHGKCVNQVVRVNTMGKISSKITAFLKLEDPQSYTGHAFRRSSATFLANAGVDVLGLKRHGGWKSSQVAEGYIEDSIENKMQFCKKILHNSNAYAEAHLSSASRNNQQPQSIVIGPKEKNNGSVNSVLEKIIGNNEVSV